MTTLYEKIRTSNIPDTLHKIIYDIDVYAKNEPPSVKNRAGLITPL